MSRMDLEERMDPINKDLLLKFINTKTKDIHSFLAELDRRNLYIEVQLWNDNYLKIED